jgi:hypothetical protein
LDIYACGRSAPSATRVPIEQGRLFGNTRVTPDPNARPFLLLTGNIRISIGWYA